MDILLGLVSVLLMIFGTVEVIRVLVFWCLKAENANEFSVVVRPEGADDCEFLIRSAAEKMKWLHLGEPCRLICVNADDNEEINLICSMLSRRYPYLVVSNSAEIEYNETVKMK